MASPGCHPAAYRPGSACSIDVGGGRTVRILGEVPRDALPPVVVPGVLHNLLAPCPGSGPLGSLTGASEQRPLKELVREVLLDLSDVDPLRLSRKMKV